MRSRVRCTSDPRYSTFLGDGSMDIDSRIAQGKREASFGAHFSAVSLAHAESKAEGSSYVFKIILHSHSLSVKMDKPGHLRSLRFPNQSPREIRLFCWKPNCRCRIRSMHVGQIRQVFPSFEHCGLPKLLVGFPWVSQIHQHISASHHNSLYW